MIVDRRPIFTIGMVWMDLVKRLPRSGARFRRESPRDGLGLNGMQQAPPEMLEVLARRQQALARQMGAWQ